MRSPQQQSARTSAAPSGFRRRNGGVLALDPSIGETVALLGPHRPARDAILSELARVDGRRATVSRADLLFPGLDVAENVAFPLRTRGVRRLERRRIATGLLARLGLERTVDLPVDRLEPHERFGALVGRALAKATDGAVVLIDELPRSIDGASRERIHVALRRLARDGRAGFVVGTADRMEALALGDRIAVLDDAGSLRVGDADALLADPGSALVAGRLGGANIVVGRVDADAEGRVLDGDDASVRLTGGATVPACLAPGVAAGDLCLLAIAPDRIAVAAIPAERMGPGALAATLVDHRHLGTHIRLRFRLADGTLLTAHRPAGSFTPRDAAIAAGADGAALAWRARDATAFPHPDA